MNKKKTINPPINPGISLLVVVFLVLCLFTFSAITLTTSISEYNRTETAVNNSNAYYAAVSQVESKINDIVKSGVAITDNIIISATINDSQELQVELIPLENQTEGEYFTISRWQVVSTKIWETDETMNLLMP